MMDVKRTCGTFGSNGAKLDAHWMLAFLEVLQTVSIASKPAKLLPSATKGAARETKP